MAGRKRGHGLRREFGLRLASLDQRQALERAGLTEIVGRETRRRQPRDEPGRMRGMVVRENAKLPALAGDDRVRVEPLRALKRLRERRERPGARGEGRGPSRAGHVAAHRIEPAHAKSITSSGQCSAPG